MRALDVAGGHLAAAGPLQEAAAARALAGRATAVRPGGHRAGLRCSGLRRGPPPRGLEGVAWANSAASALDTVAAPPHPPLPNDAHDRHLRSAGTAPLWTAPPRAGSAAPETRPSPYCRSACQTRGERQFPRRRGHGDRLQEPAQARLDPCAAALQEPHEGRQARLRPEHVEAVVLRGSAASPGAPRAPSPGGLPPRAPTPEAATILRFARAAAYVREGRPFSSTGHEEGRASTRR